MPDSIKRASFAAPSGKMVYFDCSELADQPVNKKKPQGLIFCLYFTGKNHLEAATKTIKYFQEPGAGLFEHPNYGRLYLEPDQNHITQHDFYCLKQSQLFITFYRRETNKMKFNTADYISPNGLKFKLSLIDKGDLKQKIEPIIYPVEVFFSGAQHLQQADRFIKALREYGVGHLDHPNYGVLDVNTSDGVTRIDYCAIKKTILKLGFYRTVDLPMGFYQAVDLQV